MTQKELLYLEDSIGHIDNIMQILKESMHSINDEDLFNFMKEEFNRHNTLYQELLNKLKEKANG